MVKESCGNRIRQRLDSLNMRQSELSQKTGINKSTLSQYISGKYLPTQERLEKLSSALEVDPAWLMGYNVPMRAEFRIDEDKFRDIYDRYSLYEAAAGEGRINDGYSSDEYYFRLAPDQMLFKVKGLSMQPTLMDGDIVVVSLQSVIDYPRQIALVKVNGDEFTLKRVEKKDNGLLLIADNVDVYSPHFFTTDEVENLPVTILGVAEKLVRNI